VLSFFCAFRASFRSTRITAFIFFFSFFWFMRLIEVFPPRVDPSLLSPTHEGYEKLISSPTPFFSFPDDEIRERVPPFFFPLLQRRPMEIREGNFSSYFSFFFGQQRMSLSLFPPPSIRFAPPDFSGATERKRFLFSIFFFLSRPTAVRFFLFFFFSSFFWSVPCSPCG